MYKLYDAGLRTERNRSPNHMILTYTEQDKEKCREYIPLTRGFELIVNVSASESTLPSYYVGLFRPIFKAMLLLC